MMDTIGNEAKARGYRVFFAAISLALGAASYCEARGTADAAVENLSVRDVLESASEGSVHIAVASTMLPEGDPGAGSMGTHPDGDGKRLIWRCSADGGVQVSVVQDGNSDRYSVILEVPAQGSKAGFTKTFNRVRRDRRTKLKSDGYFQNYPTEETFWVGGLMDSFDLKIYIAVSEEGVENPQDAGGDYIFRSVLGSGLGWVKDGVRCSPGK